MSERALDPNFLAEYEREAEWAPGHGIPSAQARDTEAWPDGLPFLIFGGSVWIPRSAKAAQWIASRVQRRNPRSRRRQASQAEHSAA